MKWWINPAITNLCSIEYVPWFEICTHPYMWITFQQTAAMEIYRFFHRNNWSAKLAPTLTYSSIKFHFDLHSLKMYSMDYACCRYVCMESRQFYGGWGSIVSRRRRAWYITIFTTARFWFMQFNRAYNDRRKLTVLVRWWRLWLDNPARTAGN